MVPQTVTQTRKSVHADTRAPALGPAFPAPWAVPVAAATLFDAARPGLLLSRRSTCGGEAEGPSFFITVSPGSVRFRRQHLAKKQRTDDREARTEPGQEGRKAKRVALGVAWQHRNAERAAVGAVWNAGLLDDAGPAVLVHPDPIDGDDPLSRQASRSRITEWSAKSRANMTARLLTLDYGPLAESGDLMAMVTLTLPDDSPAPWANGWVSYAPNGDAFKKLVRRLQKRYVRAWSRPLVGIWKLEFQDRGAPHLHALMAPPSGLSKCGRTWRDWLAESWADVLGVSGATRERVLYVHRRPEACANYSEGLRCSDPRRVSVYFTKHGLLSHKDYQHNVPEVWQGKGDGPGRFWGVWGLEPVEHSVEVTHDQAVKLARVARRWHRSQQPTRNAVVTRRTGRKQGPCAGGHGGEVIRWTREVVEGVRWAVDETTGEVTDEPYWYPGLPKAETAASVSECDGSCLPPKRVQRRKVHRRVKRMRGTWGFLAANDGAALALMLASALRT